MQRAWVRETAGWLGALAIALIVSGQVAASARADLLFRDGDSLVVAMFARAILGGTASDWAMSSVLFLPESTVFAGLDAVLPFDVNGVLAASAVLNLLALYGAFRVAAGRASDGMAPVAWSVIALGVFGLLAVSDLSGSRDALDLASLQLTTTYYSATVVAEVLAVGLARRYLEHTGRGLALLFVLGAVATISTLSNPLFAVWAGVPLTVILGALSIRRGGRTRMLSVLAVLLGGVIIGFLARIPFSAWIANTGAGYVQPEHWMESLASYAHLLGERLASPLGVIACVLTLALLVLAVLRSIRAAQTGARLVALSAWVIPVLVVIGAIALGTHAARYLQPLAFAPVLALVAYPRALALPARAARQSVTAVAVVLLFGSALSIPRLISSTEAPDADLTCATDWVNESGRTGAGQFWTVRLPKLHLDDPARLVQVDHMLNGYTWLVDRRDLDVGAVSFLIEDAQTVQWQLPNPAIPEQIVDCGRYRILDFGDTTLQLGPAHS
ncbi:hypothetical protein SRABI76_02594 [Microbacterium oxydans]|uniref:hypothetical protein n=1 Tax=Microbacterium oxydans TaxID=82380 RepID=UPI001D9F0662|nr:hypothetical protein [Microbacterium oxydans]CAH0224451.1 hypothetical protein SRABI76_02594 [Microbacterium oxydans]